MSEIARPRRLCIINTHPIQYYAPLYRRLAEDDDIELDVIYLSDFSLRNTMDPGFGRAFSWDVDLLSGYPNRYLGARYRTATPGRFLSFVVPRIIPTVLFGRYDAVMIYGYANATNLMALLAARISGARVLYRSDTNILLARRAERKILRDRVVRAVFALCDRFLAAGTRNSEYYRWMGVPAEKVVTCPFTVDNDRFAETRHVGTSARAALRASFAIPDDRPAALFVSKFTRRKRPDALLQAADELARKGVSFHLVMAGSGEMDAELRNMAAHMPKLSVSFPGFVNQSQMPELLAACDVFAFPTTGEPWGLIVNEAMAAGLPVIVTEEAGCAPDLVENGINGYAIPANDVDALAAALEPLLVDEALRERMGRAGLQRMETWSLRETQDGIRRALGLASEAARKSKKLPTAIGDVASA